MVYAADVECYVVICDHLELSSYLGVCDEQTVGVLMLAGDVILRQHVSQLLDKGHDFLVPGDVSHGQTAGGAFPAVCHTLDTKHTIRNKAQKRQSFTMY